MGHVADRWFASDWFAVIMICIFSFAIIVSVVCTKRIQK